MNVITAFTGIGTIILIGFIGTLIFKKYKIPDVLLLFFIGLLIGPIFTYLFNFEIVSHDMLVTFSPYLAALALVIILFDAGLGLNFDKILSHAGYAILHSLLIFIGSVAAVAILTHYLLGYPWLVGMLLGTIIGGTSSALVIPMLGGMRTTEEAKTILTIESVLTDVLCIVTFLAIIGLLSGIPLDAGGIAGQLLTPFAVAGLIGVLSGIIWLFVLKKVHGMKFAFMITLAAVFIIYAGNEYIHASGAIAALVFGVVLGNKEEVARILKLKTEFVLDENIGIFEHEISFVMRTFFFVYLGMAFTLSLTDMNFSPAIGLPDMLTSNPTLLFFLVVMIVLVSLAVIRMVGSAVTVAVNKRLKKDWGALAVMLPRGLAAAVLSQLPFTIPAFKDTSSQYYTTLAPFQSQFLNFVFLAIIFTVLFAAIGVYLIEKRRIEINEEAASDIYVDWNTKSKAYARHVKETSIRENVQKLPQTKQMRPQTSTQVRPVSDKSRKKDK